MASCGGRNSLVQRMSSLGILTVVLYNHKQSRRTEIVNVLMFVMQYSNELHNGTTFFQHLRNSRNFKGFPRDFLVAVGTL